MSSAPLPVDAPKGVLPAYLAGLVAWFAAFGIQLVMFPWLTAVVLKEPPLWVGVAQLSLMAPSILFLLWGGAVADRGDARRQLVFCHLLAGIPPLALALLIDSGRLAYGVMIVYGIAMGTISAFAIPARDGLLTRFTTLPLPKIVPIVIGLQFVAQLVGISIAWSADRVGVIPLLAIQTALVLAGGLGVRRLPAPPTDYTKAEPPTPTLQAMRDGLTTALRNGRVWPTLAVMFAVGLFYVGTFMVVLPVVVRDVYRGGAEELALVNFAFWIGTIAASFATARLAANVHRRGSLVTGAIAWGVIVLVAIALMPSFRLLLVLCLFWGLGAGVTMSQGRTIIQTVSPLSYRSRHLALFQLGFMGGAPIGALAMGATAQAFGLTVAMLAPAACMAVFIVFVALGSGILRDDTSQP